MPRCYLNTPSAARRLSRLVVRRPPQGQEIPGSDLTDRGSRALPWASQTASKFHAERENVKAVRIRCQPVQACAGPIVSAILAPRPPSGFGAPTVLSRAVWCSISALSLAPSRTTIIDTHIQVIKPIMAPSEP